MLGIVITLVVCINTVHAELSTQDMDVFENLHQVSFLDGHLSISTGNISIVKLMQLVGTMAGFRVATYGDLSSHTRSWSFSNLPLAKAIDKLLKNTNAIISYSHGYDSSGELGISTIYLLGSGSRSAETNLIRVNTVEPGLTNQLLIDQAQVDDSQGRVLAINRLEGLADEYTVANLTFALQHDPDPAVRSHAVTALQQIGDTNAATALVTGLGDDDSTIRKKVVQALGKVQDGRTSLWLGQVLMGDPSAEVRLQAVQAIAQKSNDTARIFLQAAVSDSSSMVSEAAVSILEQHN